MSRKVLTINRTYNRRSETDQLYMKRANEGMRQINVEDCVCIKIDSLMRSPIQSKETLLVRVRNEGVLRAEKVEKTKKKYKKGHEEESRKKYLHNKFNVTTIEVAGRNKWHRLMKGTQKIKRAVQDGPLDRDCRVKLRKCLRCTAFAM